MSLKQLTIGLFGVVVLYLLLVCTYASFTVIDIMADDYVSNKNNSEETNFKPKDTVMINGTDTVYVEFDNH